MKKSIYVIALLVALVGNQSIAQENATVNLISELSATTVKYQYYPNLEVYFNTETSQFIYKDNDEWKVGKEIPSGYRGYSIYNGYRVNLTDYFEDKPYEKLAYHKKQFPYYSNDRKGKLAAIKAKRLSENQLVSSE
jgi:hypothetical protein